VGRQECDVIDPRGENPKEEDEILCHCAKCQRRRELQGLHDRRCRCSGCILKNTRLFSLPVVQTRLREYNDSQTK
jgi:PHP family Zn ribbon phosphoesterase